MVSEKEVLQCQFNKKLFNYDHYDVALPYFRRINDLKHVKNILEEINESKAISFIGHGKTIFKTYNRNWINSHMISQMLLLMLETN
eukprot:snap_masked-scaffold_1-processed-gene-14.33-mRNA-1 protein AED:1.00 eAED:1.00 QI:0/-1/0/0/-1/1/1/0/85